MSRFRLSVNHDRVVHRVQLTRDDRVANVEDADYVERSILYVISRFTSSHEDVDEVVHQRVSAKATNLIVACQGENRDVLFFERREHEASNTDPLPIKILQPLRHSGRCVFRHRFHVEDFEQVEVVKTDTQGFLVTFAFGFALLP